MRFVHTEALDIFGVMIMLLFKGAIHTYLMSIGCPAQA